MIIGLVVMFAAVVAVAGHRSQTPSASAKF
jgi:hypothetical protein